MNKVKLLTKNSNFPQVTFTMNIADMHNWFGIFFKKLNIRLKVVIGVKHHG